MLGEGCPRPQDLVRQYAEQSSAQLLSSTGSSGHHHNHHEHDHLLNHSHHHHHLLHQQLSSTASNGQTASSCRAEVESANNNSTTTTHNHPHQRSRSIDRCLMRNGSTDLHLTQVASSNPKECKQCLQAVLSVHAAAANRRRLANRRVSTPTNAKLKEWFTTINHKWARIKRQVILHHQRQTPLINEDNYGSTTYGSARMSSTDQETIMSCCHASGATTTLKKVAKKGSKGDPKDKDDLLEHHNHLLQHHHHHHHCDLHMACGSSAANYRYTNGYGGTVYGTYTGGHRRTQFGRWPEEPAFGSRYAFDNGATSENVDPNGKNGIH